jgi:plastocyanin
MERTTRADVGRGERKERVMRERAWRAASMAGLIVTGLILSAVTAAHVAAVGAAAVDIKEFAFTPPTLAVPVGTTVRWINHDEEPHTITSVSGAFGSTGLSHDDTFAQTFTQPGRYEYFCALHPRMKAVVVVK